MITKESYVSANFIDNDRKNIEVLPNMDHTDAKTLTPHVIEADPDSKDYQDLMKLVSEDQLHEQTWNIKKEESQAFMLIAQQIAKDTGLVNQEELLNETKIYPTIVNTIFTNMENEDHLFALKLALFGVQEIKESTNTAEKTALRKGTNKIEVLQHAFNVTGVRQPKDDVREERIEGWSGERLNEDGTQVVEAIEASAEVDQTPPPAPTKKTTAKKTTTKKKT